MSGQLTDGPGLPVNRLRCGLTTGPITADWILRLQLHSLYDEGVKEEDLPQLDENTLGWALSFEVGLGLLALVCGYATNVWPAAKLWPVSLGTVLLGVASAIPPLLIMLSVRRVQWPPLRDLTELVDERLVPLFRGLSIWELALLSFAAGWGEELLFRGLVQGEVTDRTNIFLGILIASLIFGLVHFLSPAYFVMAFCVSIYFGWLYWQFSSLWVPILGHAVYDFLMLLFLQQTDKRNSQAEG